MTTTARTAGRTLDRMAVIHPRLSHEEYEWLMEKGDWTAPLEYLDGEVVVVPPVGGGHGSSHFAIAAVLHDWQRSAGDEGLVVLDTFVRVADNTLAPDVAYWRASRRPRVVRGRLDGLAPDLVVEIASTAANDRGPKRRAYAEVGVPEQWLVDPARHLVTIVLGSSHGRELAADASFSSAALDGHEVDVARLLGVQS